MQRLFCKNTETFLRLTRCDCSTTNSDGNSMASSFYSCKLARSREPIWMLGVARNLCIWAGRSSTKWRFMWVPAAFQPHALHLSGLVARRRLRWQSTNGATCCDTSSTWPRRGKAWVFHNVSTFPLYKLCFAASNFYHSFGRVVYLPSLCPRNLSGKPSPSCRWRSKVSLSMVCLLGKPWQGSRRWVTSTMSRQHGGHSRTGWRLLALRHHGWRFVTYGPELCPSTLLAPQRWWRRPSIG